MTIIIPSRRRPKTCPRCTKQYIDKHECEVVETEQERVYREGRA